MIVHYILELRTHWIVYTFDISEVMHTREYGEHFFVR